MKYLVNLLFTGMLLGLTMVPAHAQMHRPSVVVPNRPMVLCPPGQRYVVGRGCRRAHGEYHRPPHRPVVPVTPY